MFICQLVNNSVIIDPKCEGTCLRFQHGEGALNIAKTGAKFDRFKD